MCLKLSPRLRPPAREIGMVAQRRGHGTEPSGREYCGWCPILPKHTIPHVAPSKSQSLTGLCRYASASDGISTCHPEQPDKEPLICFVEQRLHSCYPIESLVWMRGFASYLDADVRPCVKMILNKNGPMTDTRESTTYACKMSNWTRVSIMLPAPQL